MTSGIANAPTAHKPRIRWMLFFWLVVISVALEGAELLAAPFLHINLTLALVAEVLLAAMALAAFGAGIGLWLGPAIGWDVLGKATFLRAAPLAALAGALIGVLQAIVAAKLLGQFGVHVSPAPLWLNVIGALAGAVREEIIFRMGLMTLLVWLGMRLFRQKN
ncbi:MAG: hypothetical protein ABI068_02435 [Ktedonobacterales bacterium]